MYVKKLELQLEKKEEGPEGIDLAVKEIFEKEYYQNLENHEEDHEEQEENELEENHNDLEKNSSEKKEIANVKKKKFRERNIVLFKIKIKENFIRIIIYIFSIFISYNIDLHIIFYLAFVNIFKTLFIIFFLIGFEFLVKFTS